MTALRITKKGLKKGLDALMFVYATLFVRSTTVRLPNKALLFFISFNLMLADVLLQVFLKVRSIF